MKRMSFLAIVVFVFALMWHATLAAGENPATRAAIDKPAPDFELTDTKGESHSLSEYRGKFVVLEWTNVDCPFVKKHYNSGNMQKLQKGYTKKDVVWLRVCSSGPGKQGNYPSDDINKTLKKEKSKATAYLLDTDGKVGKLYGAKTTPHMFVIDPKGILIFAGGIDDKPSTKVDDVKDANNYVSACLDAAMNDIPVEVKSSVPYGCSVKYKDN